MMKLTKQLALVFMNALHYVFCPDSELISPQADEIMSDPEDRIKVILAIDELRMKRFKGDSTEIKITLSDKRKVTIS